MPVRQMLNESFEPEDTRVLIEAFQLALQELGLKDRQDPATLLVARLIVDRARGGERDPTTLCAKAIAGLGLTNR